MLNMSYVSDGVGGAIKFIMTSTWKSILPLCEKRLQKSSVVQALKNVRVSPDRFGSRFPIKVGNYSRFFPECVAKGSRFTFGGLGVDPCSRDPAFGVRNRPQPSATVCNRPQPSICVRRVLFVRFKGCGNRVLRDTL